MEWGHKNQLILMGPVELSANGIDSTGVAECACWKLDQGKSQNGLGMPRCFNERSYVFQLVAVQFVIAAALGFAGLLFSHRVEIALSLLVGGLASGLANLWLALIAFRPSSNASPTRMLSAFYVGEAGKFAVVAVLFVLAFRRFEWLKEAGNALALFAGYLINQGVVWVSLLKKQ